MAKRVRMTGFSRFILMMIIVAPLAYIGASYYNGEDGIENIKRIINQGKDSVTDTETVKSDAPATDNESTYQIRKLQEELEYKDKRLEELYQENESLKRKVKELESQLGGS